MQNLKDLMLEKHLTLAVAESLTSGHLQARIGAISGASNFFLGGVTAYTLAQKEKLLGVPRALAEPVNCVSEAVAIAMAQGVRKLFSSDIAVATTGYAESAQNVPAPYAWYAIACADRIISRRVDCPGLDRVAVQQRVAQTAYDALQQFLQS